jgi:hypothetical protein
MLQCLQSATVLYIGLDRAIGGDSELQRVTVAYSRV